MVENVVDVSEQQAPQIDMEKLIDEIKICIRNTAQNVILIGQKLNLAKIQISHGEWGDWLQKNFDFTQSTANRFMKCALRFENYAPAHNLTQTHMFELLALPKPETEKFIKAKESEGKSIENMSKKTLRAEVKNWKKQFGQRRKSVKSSDTTREALNSNTDMSNLFSVLDTLPNDRNLSEIVQDYLKGNYETVRRNINKLTVITGILEQSLKNE